MIIIIMMIMLMFYCLSVSQLSLCIHDEGIEEVDECKTMKKYYSIILFFS